MLSKKGVLTFILYLDLRVAMLVPPLICCFRFGVCRVCLFACLAGTPSDGVLLHDAHAEGAASEILSLQHKKYYCIHSFSLST